MVGQYRRSVEVHAIAQHPSSGDVDVHVVRSSNGDGGRIKSQGAVALDLLVRSALQRECQIVIGFSEGSPAPIFIAQHAGALSPGENRFSCRLESIPLPAGEYAVYATVLDVHGRTVRSWSPIGHIEVDGLQLPPTPTGVVRLSPVVVDVSWRDGV